MQCHFCGRTRKDIEALIYQMIFNVDTSIVDHKKRIARIAIEFKKKNKHIYDETDDPKLKDLDLTSILDDIISFNQSIPYLNYIIEEFDLMDERNRWKYRDKSFGEIRKMLLELIEPKSYEYRDLKKHLSELVRGRDLLVKKYSGKNAPFSIEKIDFIAGDKIMNLARVAERNEFLETHKIFNENKDLKNAITVQIALCPICSELLNEASNNSYNWIHAGDKRNG